MTKDKQMEEFLEKDLKKDINQEGSIDKSVDQHLGEMGFLWDTIQQKFQKDKICFACKKTFDPKKDKMNILVANSKDKGVVTFVSICEECRLKQIQAQKLKDKEQEVKKND